MTGEKADAELGPTARHYLARGRSPSCQATEAKVDWLRAQRERRFQLTLQDRQPIENFGDVWTFTAQVATLGIFLLLIIAALYFGSALLLPIVVAAVIGETLAPIMSAAAARGVPRALSAALLVLTGIVLVALIVTLLAAPLTDLVKRAPEIGASIKTKLYVLDQPLAAWRDLRAVISPQVNNVVQVDYGWTSIVTPVVGFLTPAIGQIVLFLIVLFFVLVGERDLRDALVAMMPNRDARLRVLRIASDIQRNLAAYVTVVTVINVSIGVIVTTGTWLLGFPSPLLFGIMATLLNYIPYLGSAVTAVTLFGVGLVVFPTLGQALIAPLGYVVVAALEGQVVTPAVLGKHLTLNPLMIVLSLAFWTFLWGPMGTFIAAPLSIVGMVILGHLLPDNDPQLPE